MTKDKLMEAKILESKVDRLDKIVKMLKDPNGFVILQDGLTSINLSGAEEKQPSKNALRLLFENLLDEAKAEFGAL